MRMQQHTKNVIQSKAKNPAFTRLSEDSSVDACFIAAEILFAKRPAFKKRESKIS